MPTYASEAETGGGLGIVWLDKSGGFIQIAVANVGYTSLHKFHVKAFDDSGAYTSPGGSDEADLNATAANLIALLKPMFASGTALSPVAVYKTNTPGDGVTPFSYSFDAGLSVGGSSSGTATSPSTQSSLTAKGSDYSRWQAHFFGCADDVWAGPTRGLTNLSGGAIDQLAQYLAHARTGPGLAGHGVSKNTMVVTHAGAEIVNPVWLVMSVNKRIRRRLHIS